MLLIVCATLIYVIFSHHVSSTSPYCLNQTCGKINVIYPFSLRSSAAACPPFSSFFELECNNSSGKLYFNNLTYNGELTPLQVIEIHNDSLIVDITSLRANLSTNTSGNFLCEDGLVSTDISLPPFPGPYFISDDNKFGSFSPCMLGVLITAKVINGSSSEFGYSDYDVGGCGVMLSTDKNNSECGNRTCCVSPLPLNSSSRLAFYSASITAFSNGTSCNNPCSNNYATLFHPDYTNFTDEIYHLKLNWALPSNQTTNIPGLTESSDYACIRNSNVTIVNGVPGYLCSCNPGYAGDGYSNGSGCSDINECVDPNSHNDCIPRRTTCQNLEGSYRCKCNFRFHVGDGLLNGSGCRFSPVVTNAFIVSGVIFGLVLFMGGLVLLARWWKKRTKRKYFIQNGGLQLQAYTSVGGRAKIKLFSAEELKVATNNYSKEMQLGVGGFGTVFKGILQDESVVAIKKANTGGVGNNEQFLNEMAILMNINHRHIVKILGFCLETTNPLLVYEYVSNGNVAENLESTKGDHVMGWEERLKVARQTAEALAYLHGAASPPILHRDVKPANVLLDDNFDAKLADFGISRLVPQGVEHVSTVVQGTLGYLDPEYFQTLQLTDKSDVYSLGVMLVELITSLKVVDCHRREPSFSNLALLFIKHMREGRVDELIDPRLENPSTLPIDAMSYIHSSIMAVATLACRCLAVLGDERPSMVQVANELHHITQSLPRTNADDDESLPLLPSKQTSDMYRSGAVVAQNAEYSVQSTSESVSIDRLLLNATTMPR